MPTNKVELAALWDTRCKDAFATAQYHATQDLYGLDRYGVPIRGNPMTWFFGAAWSLLRGMRQARSQAKLRSFEVHVHASTMFFDMELASVKSENWEVVSAEPVDGLITATLRTIYPLPVSALTTTRAIEVALKACPPIDLHVHLRGSDRSIELWVDETDVRALGFA